MNNLWMIRAEVGGRLFEKFKSEGVVAIGWHAPYSRLTLNVVLMVPEELLFSER